MAITVTDFVMDYDADDDGLDRGHGPRRSSTRSAGTWTGTGSQATPAMPRRSRTRRRRAWAVRTTGCTGYELMADLDLDTDGSGTVDAADDYWNERRGLGAAGRQHHRVHRHLRTATGTRLRKPVYQSGDATDTMGLFGQDRVGQRGAPASGLPDVAVTGQLRTSAGWWAGTRARVTSSHALAAR